MTTKTTGRNWTRKSIEEIFDSMFKKYGSGGGGDINDVRVVHQIETVKDTTYYAGAATYEVARYLRPSKHPTSPYPFYKIEGKDTYTLLEQSSIEIGKIDIFDTTLAYDIIAGIYWFDVRSFLGAAQLICVPPTGNDIYQILNPQTDGRYAINRTIRTMTAAVGGTTYSKEYYQISTSNTVSELVAALQGVAGFVNDCKILLVVGNTGDSSLIDDTSLLSIANTILAAQNPNYTNVITV